jgi:hypothetical protein
MLLKLRYNLPPLQVRLPVEVLHRKAIEQIAVAYQFKSARPKAQDIFDPSFLPVETERRAN